MRYNMSNVDIEDSDIETMSDKELSHNISWQIAAVLEDSHYAPIYLDNLLKLWIELKKRGLI